MIDPAEDEVLVADHPRRGGLLAGGLVILALLAWLVVREPAGQPAPAVATPSVTSSAGPTVDLVVPVPASTLDQLVFLDDVRAVALRSDCPPARGQSGVCRRTLLVSEDAGARFEVRGRLPVSADGAQLLLADAGGVVAVIDERTFTTIFRSRDGGRTWTEVPLVGGTPAPLPAHTAVMTTPTPGCPQRCGDLFWLDVVTGTTHALPTQPGGPQGGFWYASPPTPDGALAATNAVGTVAVSVDRGATWTRSELPVEAAARSGLPVVLVTGARRVYAFVSVLDAAGLASDVAFRSDDAGDTWVDLDYPSRPVDGLPPQEVPRVVLDGEVLTTNDRDGVLRSSGGGTAFREIPGSPEDVQLRQRFAEGPVLAVRYGSTPTYWLSRDGQTWTPLLLPAG